MNTFLATIAFTTALLFPTELYSKYKPEQRIIHQEVLDPVVKINNNCSAVSIGNSKLLTAEHCIEGTVDGSFNIDVYQGGVLSNQYSIYYKVIKSDAELDIALLEINDKTLELPSVVIAETLPVEADEIWAVGYPGGMSRTITTGLYNGEEYGNFGGVTQKSRLRSSAPIYSGNSGGGLFKKNGEHFELVGIVVAAFDEGKGMIPHMNISVHLDDIKLFLSGT